MSLISILPHMHLIGKSWLVYAENNGDTIPIISIPDWDFNWQNFYQPEYMLKLPQGYTLHAYAVYDNTSSNTLNHYIFPGVLGPTCAPITWLLWVLASYL